ncbi:ATP-binding protein [Neobacillus dielmonensis]|uniref:ATP-binding protein n=1 Tax=Neobacillus dielmonensis TaxID=1347369 RepID=UPI0006949C07|nr:ATP-binding protein [Neobacillus dielmonensis]
MQHGVDEVKRRNCLLDIYIDVNLERYFSVLSNDADPFFIVNMSGKLAYVNKHCELLLKCPKIELEKLFLNDLFSPTFIDESQSFFHQKSRDKLINFDSKITLKSREFMDVNVTAFPILFDKEVVGNYVVLEDITMIKRERELLAEKQAVAGQLAAGIAHEIRNPITAIKGFLQLIMSEYTGDMMYFKVVESEINRIEGILKELMILAKPNQTHYEEVNIHVLLEQVLALMESQALLYNVEVEKKYRFTDETIIGDQNQLKQVFINYIKNAIEAMPNGGSLFIEGSYSDISWVQIRVIDQGGGIPSDIIGRIHEPFFTTKESGTGLGMSVSYQIIEEHKGKVKIMSNTQGTCVEVQLPMVT